MRSEDTKTSSETEIGGEGCLVRSIDDLHGVDDSDERVHLAGGHDEIQRQGRADVEARFHALPDHRDRSRCRNNRRRQSRRS